MIAAGRAAGPSLLAAVVVAACASPRVVSRSSEPARLDPRRDGAPRVELCRDERAHTVTVRIDRRDVLTYQHGPQYAIPHIWPLRSPSGRLLTVQHPDPYPHHRSLWIADAVQLEDGPVVDFYHCWKNYVLEGQPAAGFKHRIRHMEFHALTTAGDRATVTATLRWMIDDAPVIDETRVLRAVALADGEYFVDLAWRLTAAYGNVTFHSDRVHYAWPFVRMHPQFSGDRGGTLVDDRGRQGQKATNGRYARWLDYSNVVEGRREGLAVFLFPDGKRHRWLTREYGCFGPRRPDDRNGTKFTLRKGESIAGRVGLLVHRGGVEAGGVARRYRQYCRGRL